jgi:hypothetical protein
MKDQPSIYSLVSISEDDKIFWLLFQTENVLIVLFGIQYSDIAVPVAWQGFDNSQFDAKVAAAVNMKELLRAVRLKKKTGGLGLNHSNLVRPDIIHPPQTPLEVRPSFRISDREPLDGRKRTKELFRIISRPYQFVLKMSWRCGRKWKNSNRFVEAES